jgi:hypothetical protein
MNIKKEVLKSQEELKRINITNKEIITKAKFGPSKDTRIPFLLDEHLAFFVATIIGDGHLKKSKLQISIELSNKKLLDYIKKTCLKLFNRNFNIRPVKQRDKRKPTYQIAMDSKAIYFLLNKVFEVQIGNKSNIVFVPKVIKESSNSIKSAFLIGIMLTEGGNRRKGYGLSTSSKTLWEDLIQLFNEIGIKVFIDRWIYKKYNKEYYGFYFKKDKIINLIEKCQNKELSNFFKQFFS